MLPKGASPTAAELTNRIGARGQYPCDQMQDERAANYDERGRSEDTGYPFRAEGCEGLDGARIGPA